MATILLPPDFREFLRLLNSHEVEYLVIGGYAVNYHGYPRATGDIDIWMGDGSGNAERMASAVREFGFPGATAELFTKPGKIVRMGLPPLRIEVLTSVSGVEFSECFRNRLTADLGGVPVNVIGFDDLKANKKASGRLKDLADLEELD
jgi:hypothetical protein